MNSLQQSLLQHRVLSYHFPPALLVQGFYKDNTLYAITKNLLHLTLNTSTQNLQFHCLHGSSSIPPPYNTPTFTPISTYTPTGTLYFSHPPTSLHSFTPSSSSVTTHIPQPSLTSSLLSYVLPPPQPTLKIIDLTSTATKLYALTSDGVLNTFSSSVFQKVENFKLPEIQEWNMRPLTFITSGLLQGLKTSEECYVGVRGYGEVRLFEVTGKLGEGVRVEGVGWGVDESGRVVVVDEEGDVRWLKGSNPSNVSSLKLSVTNLKSYNICTTIRPTIDVTNVMREIVGSRDGSRERCWEEIKRRVDEGGNGMLKSPTSNIYRAMASRTGGRSEDLAVKEIVDGFNEKYKILVLGETIGRKGCITTIMEHEQVQNQYVDRVLAEVEGEVWGDIFFKVEELGRGVSSSELSDDLQAFIETYGNDFSSYFTSVDASLPQPISTYHTWCLKYSALKSYLKGYILLHASLSLGLTVESDLLETTRTTVVELLGGCYILSQTGKQLENKAAKCLSEDMKCRELDEVRVEAGKVHKWGRWCDFLKVDDGISFKKFWKGWEGLMTVDSVDISKLAEMTVEVCKVKSYVARDDGTPRNVVEEICKIEASQLVTSKAGWETLPKAHEMVEVLIELECNLSLLNAFSNSSARYPSSETVERCDRIIAICDGANLNKTQTVAQVHSLKFAELLKEKDWERAHAVCMDKRNVEFERRKGMMRRLAVNMVEEGKLEALCSSIPLVVMTGGGADETCDTLTLMVSALTGHGYGDEAATLAGSKGEWRVAAVCAKSDEGKVACLSMVKEGEKQWIVKEGEEDRIDRFRTMKDIVKESMGEEKWPEWKEGGKWREAEDYGRIVHGDDVVRFGEFLNEVAREVVKKAVDLEPGMKEEWQFLERLVKTYGDKTNNLALNVAGEILKLEDGRGDLPLWLTGLLTKSSSNSLFATVTESDVASCDENAPGLLRLYISHGLYADALKLVIECLGDKEARINEALAMDMRKLQAHVPYNVIDTLFELVDETLMGGLGFGLMSENDQEDLRRYRDLAENSLRGHFEVLKVVAENENANRAKHR
ncbi:hypothetical protein TrST_g3214 [Triparma strigata]|uniref:Uncharacterized protein n=2 Tax=Triparma strigata TaxID=1606541 RepID=A0A9W7AJS5_9STRA|nr:hypothetical protein TrST_g3214 [Triparma strigata]